MNPREIEVEIGELVLHGFDGADRDRVGDAVRQELVRLLAAGGIALAPGASRDAIDAGSFVRAPNARPSDVGAQVARAVHGGLASPRPGGSA